jgi:hypothetical protein
MHQFRQEMTAGFKSLEERLVAIEAAAAARGAERARSAAKGGDFEDLLETMLADLARGTGDLLDRTGTDTGAVIKSKKGDFVLTLDARVARGCDVKVVIEAKDRPMSMRAMREELREARENRGAAVAVVIFSQAHAPAGVAPFNLVGDDVYCVIDPEDPEPATLEAAVRLARLLALASLVEREVEMDAAAIGAALTAIREQVEVVRTLKAQLHPDLERDEGGPDRSRHRARTSWRASGGRGGDSRPANRAKRGVASWAHWARTAGGAPFSPAHRPPGRRSGDRDQPAATPPSPGRPCADAATTPPEPGPPRPPTDGPSGRPRPGRRPCPGRHLRHDPDRHARRTGRYIVLLRSGSDTAAVIDKVRKRDGVKADRTFTKALRGFSAKLDEHQKHDLLADPNVEALVPDEVVHLTAQTIPTGISRVGGLVNPIAAIDGNDTRVDADVAIVDTGITAVPDLNVAGGHNCATSDQSAA